MDCIDAVMYRRNYRLIYYLLKHRLITEDYLEDKVANDEIFNKDNPYIDPKTSLIIKFFRNRDMGYRAENFVILKNIQALKAESSKKICILGKVRDYVFDDIMNNYLSDRR